MFWTDQICLAIFEEVHQVNIPFKLFISFSEQLFGVSNISIRETGRIPGGHFLNQSNMLFVEGHPMTISAKSFLNSDHQFKFS